MSNRKRYIIIGITIFIIVAIGLFALISQTSKRIEDSFTIQEKPEVIEEKELEEEKVAKILDEEEKIEEVIENKKEPTLLDDDEEKSGGLSSPITKELTVCPSLLQIGYLIDHKKTTSSKDDDVYVSIKNNKPFEDDIIIFVDKTEEGIISIKGLGIAILKSEIITAWWQTLNENTEKEFSIRLAPTICSEIRTTITVSYPPSEGDYLD